MRTSPRPWSCGPAREATAKDIRRFAIGRLAAFKVPRQVLVVPELPAGPTGKVPRVSLAARLGLTTPVATPEELAERRTPFEEVLASLWAQVLEVERVGIHDDFFALGGDSLLATQLLARLHEALGVEVAFSDFFEAPTVADLARHVEALMQVGPGEVVPAIARASRDQGVPASRAQEGLWHVERALPGLPFFNILHVLRLAGPLRAEVLEQSLDEIARRHEILRTALTDVDGRLVAAVAPTMRVPVAADDLHALPETEREALGHRIIQEEALRPFDLRHGPLLRARLLRCGQEEHLLILTLHQAIADGWSLGVLVDELASLYEAIAEGKPSPLPPLAIQYADFAAWQRDWPWRAATVAQLAYWREQLRDPLPGLELPTDYPRRAAVSLRTARQPVVLPAALSEAVRRHCHGAGSTVFMALVAAFTMLWHSRLGEVDARVATLLANRRLRGTEALIGPLVNTVILRTDLGGDPSAQEVLRRVRATTLAAHANQDLPFDDLVDALRRERGLRPRSLAPAMIVLQNASLRPLARSGRTLGWEEANPSMRVPLVAATTFDIVLMLHEGPRELTGTCLYKPDLFAGPTIARLLADFQEVLAGLVRQPERALSAIRRSLHERSRGAVRSRRPGPRSPRASRHRTV